MGWADLPEELLNLILSHFFPNTRKTVGLVCRSWNAIVNQCPWLIFYQRSKRVWKFIQSDDVLLMDFPKLYNANIRCAKYGWLLMSRDDFTLFFFDPFGEMTIELPKIDYRYTTISFFHPPTSPRCFLFGIADLVWDSTTLEIGIHKLGEDKWMNYSCINKFPFEVCICNPVLHRGILYCLDQYGNIGTFDINGQFSQRSWKVYTKCLLPSRLPGKIKQHFLFKIHGKKSIFAVFVEHDERQVNVFRLLEPEMKWISVENIGDNMLFMSYFATFAQTAPKKNMGNRIYFPTFHGDKGVFYSLDTRKYHSFEGDYINNSCYDMKELRSATWLTPMPTLEKSTS